MKFDCMNLEASEVLNSLSIDEQRGLGVDNSFSRGFGTGGVIVQPSGLDPRKFEPYFDTNSRKMRLLKGLLANWF